MINRAASLEKEYGPLHSMYLVYLLGYFGAMVITIIYATVKSKIDSLAYAVIIAIAVFVNLGVWMIEQLVYLEFEFLSVSYIISECFLLGLHFLVAETHKQAPVPQAPTAIHEETAAQIPAVDAPLTEQKDSLAMELFLTGLSNLTPKERELYECYIAGMTTDVIMEKLAIKENTLKFHNKNLYSKLNVSSRKQLAEIYCKR